MVKQFFTIKIHFCTYIIYHISDHSAKNLNEKQLFYLFDCMFLKKKKKRYIGNCLSYIISRVGFTKGLHIKFVSIPCI